MSPMEALESWLGGGLPSAVEEEAEGCTRSFDTFSQRAWVHVESDTPLLWEEPHRVMAEHAQELILGFVRVKLHAVAQGYAHNQLPRVSTARLPMGRKEREAEVRTRARLSHLWATGRRIGVLLSSGRVEYRPQLFNNLLVNIGTGYGKSRELCVLAPAWMWLQWPSAWQQTYSINAQAAARDAGLQLKLLEAPWFRTTFRPWWGIDPMKTAESNYRNTEGGLRMARGWTAQSQGDRSHLQLVDDPEKPDDIYNDGQREATKRAWDGRIVRRIHPGGTSIRIGVQQRLHHDDWSAHVLRTGEWEHLELATEATAEPSPCECPTHKRGRTLLGWRDTRPPPTPNEEPVLLAPRLVPRKEVASRKASPLIFKAQDQQRPEKLEGKVFPADKWRFWRFHEEPEADTEDMRARTIVLPPRREWESYFEGMWLLSGDMSFGLSTDGSMDALGVWARRGQWRMLVDLEWDHLRMALARKAVRRLLEDNPLVGPKVLEKAAQAGGVADSLTEGAEELQEEAVEGIVLQPPEGSKVMRAISIQHLHEAMNLVLPLHHPKRQAMVEEAAAFPRQGRRNDFVDMMSLALRYWQKHEAEWREVKGLTSRAWEE